MVLDLRGYTAWIESDGERLEEYAVEVKGNTISCYVCSEEGKVKAELSRVLRGPSFLLTERVQKQFILHFYDENPNPCSRGIDVKIDGSLVDTLWGDRGESLTSDGMAVGNRVRSYTFARIETTGSCRWPYHYSDTFHLTLCR